MVAKIWKKTYCRTRNKNWIRVLAFRQIWWVCLLMVPWMDKYLENVNRLRLWHDFRSKYRLPSSKSKKRYQSEHTSTCLCEISKTLFKVIISYTYFNLWQVYPMKYNLNIISTTLVFDHWFSTRRCEGTRNARQKTLQTFKIKAAKISSLKAKHYFLTWHITRRER